MQNWALMTHPYHAAQAAVAAGRSSPTADVLDETADVLDETPRVSKRNSRAVATSSSRAAPAKSARRGTRPKPARKVITDKISRGGGDDAGVIKPRASSMIRVTNRTHWHPAEGGLPVNAEVLCVFGDRLLAVCESPTPAEGEWAGLALLTTPLKMLPGSVLTTVTARAQVRTTARRGFKQVRREDFKEARYAATGTVPERSVWVAVAGPLKGRTMDSRLMDDIIDRVWYRMTAASSSTKKIKKVKNPYILDDTPLMRAGLFDSANFCEHVYALDNNGAPTTDVGSSTDSTVRAWVVRVLSSPATAWLVHKPDVRKLRSVPALLSALQAPAAPPRACGPLTQRFFLCLRAAVFRGWPATKAHVNNRGAFVLCNVQVLSALATAANLRCCCGLMNNENNKAFDDGNEFFARRRCTEGEGTR